MPSKDVSEPGRFVSLRIKISALILSMLAVVMLGSTLVNYYRAVGFEKIISRDNLEQLQETFVAILARSDLEFQRIASQFKPVVARNAAGRNTYTVPEPELFTNVDSINILDADGRPLSQWALDQEQTFGDLAFFRQGAKLIQGERRPVSRLYCRQGCQQSVFVPIIASDRRELIINANREVSSLILDFRRITGADIALLLPGARAADRESLEQHLLVSSNPGHTRHMIELIARKAADGDDGEDETHFLDIDERHFSARLQPLPRDAVADAIEALIIADETTIAEYNRLALINWLGSSLISLLIISILIYIAMQRSVNRISALAKILPRMAHSEYEEVRQDLARMRRHRTWRDEIDVLVEITDTVNRALESLNEWLARNTHDLEIQIEQLAEAEHLNQLILDGSPLALIVHAHDGRIHTINHFARELTNISLEATPDINISSFILPDLSRRSLHQVLAPLVAGKETRIQSEHPLLAADGNEREFIWIHTPITIGGEKLILSAGLDITERRQTEDRLRWISRHDRVTGLLNRAALSEEMNDLVQKHEGTHIIQLVLLDIDRFVDLNDRYGFQRGDYLLRQTASHLKSFLPPHSLLGRTGSNEFCIFLMAEGHQDEEILAEEDLKNLTQFSVKMGSETLSLSLTGVIVHYPMHGESVEELLSNAAATIKVAKFKYNGTIVDVSNEPDNRQLRQEKQAVKDRIQRAFNEHRFVLLYQPIYHLEQNRITHCECLVRMVDDNGKFIPPYQFLGVAREFGLMPKLDHHVLRMALNQQKQWSNQGIDLKLSVNITAPTFEDPHFAEHLSELLEETGGRADHLIFEIVETDAIDNLSAAQHLCRQLKEFGAEIAFDDFGVGFTSFEYLRELPVDYIKIDQSFIRFLHERENDQFLVKSMVEMSLGLGKKVVAEGVENRQIAELLAGMGVQYLQGYYLARPLPESELDLSYRLQPPIYPATPPE